MENRQRRNTNTNTNNNTNTSNISFNNPIRGYSNRHSAYDNAFNMDFEYSYLDLMTNFGSFISRTQELYSNMETCISSIIETQTERRRLINIRRSRRNNNMMQHLVSNDNNIDDDDDNDDNINNDLVDSHDSHSSHSSHSHHESTTGVQTNDNNARDSDTNTNTRRDLFDIASVVYSIPRTVLLNPDTTSNNIINRRRNGGLTISEIEENTEIVSYNSILSNDILNTECPITRETFTPQSVVLILKQCKHCFVPFRMMTWLETHATCPLCRCNVIQNTTNTTNTQTEVNNTTNAAPNATTTDNSIRESNINISNLFNNLIRSGNNDFNNLSIDNVNDNSIIFSFDVPSSSLPSEGNANSTLLPQIERLMANTLYGNMYNRQTTPVAPVAPTSTATTATTTATTTTTTTNSSNSTNTSDTTNTYVNNNFNNYPDLD